LRTKQGGGGGGGGWNGVQMKYNANGVRLFSSSWYGLKWNTCLNPFVHVDWVCTFVSFVEIILRNEVLIPL
jgi:hypothetical protein